MSDFYSYETAIAGRVDTDWLEQVTECPVGKQSYFMSGTVWQLGLPSCQDKRCHPSGKGDMGPTKRE